MSVKHGRGAPEPERPQIADLYLAATGTPIFTWGSGVERRDAEQTRRRYLDALRAADRGDCSLLVSFARS